MSVFQADIWSLGCTVVEMATGKMPSVEVGLTKEGISKIGFHKIHSAIPVELSDRARKFIVHCFVVDPNRRPLAANLLEDPFMIEYILFSFSIRNNNKFVTLHFNIHKLFYRIFLFPDKCIKSLKIVHY